MYGTYLPAGTFPHVHGPYTVCLYDTKDEAEADLPRIRRYHGYTAYIEEAMQ